MKTIFKLGIGITLLTQIIIAKPIHAVSTAQFTTEILLAIGAEDQMAGTAYLDDEILPSLKESYEKVPVLSNKYPSKEKFYSVDPDFVTGWDSVVNPKNLGPLDELEANGVKVYIMKSLESSDLNDVFADILEYGKIFELEDNANKLVEGMKADLMSIQDKLPDKKIKVFVYDSGDTAPFTVAGEGIANTMINLAGGENIFDNIKGSFSFGNWEKVLIEEPDTIIIVNYGDKTVEDKIKFLKEKSPIKECEAVKNNKFIVVGLSDLSAGVRNVETIKKLTKAFHNIEI